MKKTIITISITLMLIFSCRNIIAQSNFNIDKDSNRWAVIITAGEPNRDSKNAEDLNNILKKNGWDESNIIYLKEKEATKEAILNLSDFLEIQGLQQNDLIIFYFSMHGGRKNDVEPFDEPDGLDEFLVSYKDEKQDENIIDDELAIMFNKIKNDNLVIIFEACFSGGMIDGECDLKKSGRIIITSTKEDETSYPLFLIKSWLFPYYINKGLTGKADKNRDGFVSAEEIYRFAELPTKIRSTIYGFLLFIFHKALFNQHPQIYDGWPSTENNKEELKLIKL